MNFKDIVFEPEWIHIHDDVSFQVLPGYLSDKIFLLLKGHFSYNEGFSLVSTILNFIDKRNLQLGKCELILDFSQLESFSYLGLFSFFYELEQLDKSNYSFAEYAFCLGLNHHFHPQSNSKEISISDYFILYFPVELRDSMDHYIKNPLPRENTLPPFKPIVMNIGMDLHELLNRERQNLTNQETLSELDLELQRSEERFRVAYGVSKIGIWEWYKKGNIMHFDDHFYTLAGWEPGEFPATMEAYYDLVHPDDVESLKRVMASFFLGMKKTFRESFRFKKKDGSFMWVDGRGTISAKDDSGQPLRLVGTHTDVTNEKYRERRGTLINNLQGKLLKPGAVEDKLTQVVEALIPSIDADFSRIWLLRPADRCQQGCIHFNTEYYNNYCLTSRRCLQLIASAGRYTHIDGDHSRIPLDFKLIGQVFTGELKEFYSNNISDEFRMEDSSWVNDLNLKSVALHQLDDGDGHGIGILGIFSQHVITPEIVTFIQSTSNLCSRVILNATTMETLEEALTLSEKANQLMEGREVRIRQIKEEVNLLSDELGRGIVYANINLDEDHSDAPKQDDMRLNALSLAEDAEISRRVVAEMNEQLHTIRRAVNNSSDGVAISTKWQDVFYLNETFSKLFGYGVTDLALISIKELFPNPDWFDDALEQTASDGLWTGRVELITKNSMIIPIFLRIALFRDDLEAVLGLIWNFTDVSLQIESEKKIQEYTDHIEQDLMEKESMLHKARLLQRKFIQTNIPLLENYNIHALYMPCEQLGGDFFNIIKGLDHNKLIIVLGDCTGHGLNASMDASLLSSLINQYLSNLYETDMTGDFLRKINNDFMDMSDEDQFPTIFVAVVDTDKHLMYYSSANGETPVIVNGGKVHSLEKAAGMHIGYFEDPEFERKVYKFQDGDRLVCFSDALKEIKKPNGEWMDNDEWEEMLLGKTESSMEFFHHLINSLEEKNGSFPLADDATIIQIDFNYPIGREKSFHSLDEWKLLHLEIKNLLISYDYRDDFIEKMSIALDEMCLNALTHGNKNDITKMVKIGMKIDCKACEFFVEDEGDGFDPANVRDPVSFIEEVMERDDEEEYTHGRGIWIARNFSNELKYNDKGNRVSISKCKKKYRVVSLDGSDNLHT